jgi:Tfp pilus assembly protein PilN
VRGIVENYSPQDRQSMHRWFRRSVFVLIAICLCIVLATLQQYIAYHDIRQEHAQLKSGTVDLHACLARKRELKERVERLDARLAKLNRMKYQPKNPAILLRTLETMILC